MKFLQEIEAKQAEREELKRTAEAAFIELADRKKNLEMKADKAKTEYFVSPNAETEAAASDAMKEVQAAKSEYHIKNELLLQMRREFLIYWSIDDIMADVETEYKNTGLDKLMKDYEAAAKKAAELKEAVEGQWNAINSTVNTAAYNVNRAYLTNAERDAVIAKMGAYLMEKHQTVYNLPGMKEARIPNIYVDKAERYRFSID